MNSRRTLLRALVAVGAAGVVILAWASYSTLRTHFAAGMKARVRAEADLLAVALAGPARSRDIQTVAEESARRLGLRVTLIAVGGVVVGDSSIRRSALSSMENHGDRPEVVAAVGGGPGEAVRRSGTTGVDFFYLARRVEENERIRFVRLALPASQLGRVPVPLLLALLFPAAAMLLALAAVGYRAHRRISLGVEAMSEAALRDGPDALRGAGVPELERLAGAVSRLGRDLQARTEALREEMRQASSVIGEMREGLLVVDEERRVLLTNDALRRIFGLTDDPGGRLLAQVIRNPEVIRSVDAALEEPDGEVTKSVFQAPESGRTFELRVTPRGPGQQGALILFFDITRLEALEGVRRDFVANVSHELRTPLTSIKAFVETLVEGGLEDRDNSLQFLEIVRKHARRMEELIDDLTDLSRIETGAVRLELAELDARDVVREVAERVGERYRGTAVALRIELPAPFRLVADRRRLEQVLWNLVDNAVKFSRSEGTVRIAGGRRDGRPYLVVEDDGVGIPADSIEQVFHRFYRVDRARSKEVGGTGLGLAIVKHLMRLHDGTVRVESEVGRGSRFTVEFPGREGETQ